MTNGEKYKKAFIRKKAFDNYCRSQACSDIKCKCNRANCAFEWLELEADEYKADKDNVVPK